MKTRQFFILISFLILFSTISKAQNQAKREKIFTFERADKDNDKKVDNKLREDMGRFLGFGINAIVEPVENQEPNNLTDSKRKIKKSGYNLQLGFQLPKFIKTDPPNKIFKVGWNLGLNI